MTLVAGFNPVFMQRFKLHCKYWLMVGETLAGQLHLRLRQSHYAFTISLRSLKACRKHVAVAAGFDPVFM